MKTDRIDIDILCKSHSASELGIINSRCFSDSDLAAMNNWISNVYHRLVEDGFEPLLISGFRTPEVNLHVGGSPQSDHMINGTVFAGDLRIQNKRLVFVDYIRRSMRFRECILYNSDVTGRYFSHVHISADACDSGNDGRIKLNEYNLYI